MQEDIRLLEESLINPKKWSIISKRFLGRTQHNIKNRFIVLISNAFSMKREKTRTLLNEKDISGITQKTLEELQLRENFESKEHMSQSNLFEDSFEVAVDYLFGSGKKVDNEEKENFFSEITQLL